LENLEPDTRTGICQFGDHGNGKNWQQRIEIAVFILTVYLLNDFKAHGEFFYHQETSLGLKTYFLNFFSVFKGNFRPP
jgi:hypothetical protein